MFQGQSGQPTQGFLPLDHKYAEPDKQDLKWQALWVKHKELLQGRRDTEELRDRLTLAVNRTKASEAILKALDAREMFELRKLWDKYGAKLRNYGPLADRQSDLEELLGKADRVLGIQKKLHLHARRIVVPHPRGKGTIDVSAPLPPHMEQTFNLLGWDVSRYDPIVEAPEE